MSTKNPSHVPMPSSVTPAALFDKTVGSYKTLLATLIKDQLIGKTLTRSSDHGMFSYDVVARYPDLAESYTAMCPQRTDLSTMQKTVLKYVEGIPATVASTLGELSTSKASQHCDLTAKILAAAQASPSDLPLKDFIISCAITMILQGKMRADTGETIIVEKVSSGGKEKGAGPTTGAKIQTRPKHNLPGGKATEESIVSPLAPSLSDAVGPIDPMIIPPQRVMACFTEHLLGPSLALVKADVELFSNNCIRFNANNPDPAYVNAAQSMRTHAAAALASLTQQLQGIFTKWWKASGVWKTISYEGAKCAAAAAAEVAASRAATPPPEVSQTASEPSASPASRRLLNFSRKGGAAPTPAAAVAEPVASTPAAAPPQPIAPPAEIHTPAPTVAVPTVVAAPPPAPVAPSIPKKALPSISEAHAKANQHTVAVQPPPPKATLAKMASFEETRRAERQRLLELMAKSQAGTSAFADNNKVAAAPPTAAACPPALAYAIPQTMRVDAVMEHLGTKSAALAEARKYREAALKSVFGKSYANPQEAKQQQSAAMLFSVFKNPTSAATEKTESEQASKDAPQTNSGSESIFADSANRQSAVATLDRFYQSVVATSKRNPQDAEAVSVSGQILSAYTDMQLRELRELLTLLVAAVHKATAVTPVLFYGHELAAWYLRRGHKAAALASTSGPAKANDDVLKRVSNGDAMDDTVTIKREREETTDDADTPSSGYPSLPSFWSAISFPAKRDADAALETAGVLSTKILVRLLMWFPHLVASCARTASSSARGKLPDDAANVSYVISGAVACPLVEQLLAFIDAN